MYKKILLAADGSENDLRIADEAIKLASLSEGCMIDVLFVDVGANSPIDLPLPGGKEEAELAEREQIVPVLEKIKAHHIKQTFTVLYGEPPLALIEYANSGQADMIVLGKRILNAWQGLILESVSQQVVKKADIPVLIVK